VALASAAGSSHGRPPRSRAAAVTSGGHLRRRPWTPFVPRGLGMRKPCRLHDRRAARHSTVIEGHREPEVRAVPLLGQVPSRDCLHPSAHVESRVERVLVAGVAPTSREGPTSPSAGVEVNAREPGEGEGDGRCPDVARDEPNDVFDDGVGPASSGSTAEPRFASTTKPASRSQMICRPTSCSCRKRSGLVTLPYASRANGASPQPDHPPATTISMLAFRWRHAHRMAARCALVSAAARERARIG